MLSELTLHLSKISIQTEQKNLQPAVFDKTKIEEARNVLLTSPREVRGSDGWLAGSPAASRKLMQAGGEGAGARENPWGYTFVKAHGHPP